MRVAFAGTPPFAASCLAAVLAAGHEVPLVVTQPDRPAGRGLRLTASAVAQEASRRGIPLFKPKTLRDPEAVQRLAEARADVLVVAAFGLLLPADVLALPPHGCINVHASLLPRWRGAAPIQRALLAGDEVTGVCIMQMDAGLDTGPVLLRREYRIGPGETTRSLTEALGALGAEALVEALARLPSLVAQAQDAGQATYAAKIAKSEARIDWARPSGAIDRQVRAFDPAPGAETRLEGEVVKVWAAHPVEGEGEPGTVLASAEGPLVVACGQGALALTLLQRAGSRRLEAAEFLRGHPLIPGQRLESAPAALG